MKKLLQLLHFNGFVLNTLFYIVDIDGEQDSTLLG